MRTADLPLPALVPHQVPPDAPIARWPARPRIAIQTADGVPVVWDQPGAVWDDPDPRNVWDGQATAPTWTDAVCDWQAMSIDNGQPDDLGIYPATELILSLDNRSGAWSTWTPAGRLARYPIGTPIAVWSTHQGVDRWMFAGRVRSWQQTDDRVTVTAFDAFADLAADYGAPWTPGAPGENPRNRITAIVAQTGVTVTVAGDVGQLPLDTAPVDADVSGLEAIERAALSDGGVVIVSPDGRLIYRDRRWRDGNPDQPRVWPFTDNACDTGAIAVWDPDTGADDFALATDVRLTNLAGTVVAAASPAPIVSRLTHPDPDWWHDQADGQALADWLLGWNNTPGYRVNTFDLHLLDPQQPDVWVAGLEARRGDRFGWVTYQPGTDGAPFLMDLTCVVAGVRHDLTPDSWLVTITGTRAVSSIDTSLILWDETTLVWDDPNPQAVWRT